MAPPAPPQFAAAATASSAPPAIIKASGRPAENTVAAAVAAGGGGGGGPKQSPPVAPTVVDTASLSRGSRRLSAGQQPFLGGPSIKEEPRSPSREAHSSDSDTPQEEAGGLKCVWRTVAAHDPSVAHPTRLAALLLLVFQGCMQKRLPQVTHGFLHAKFPLHPPETHHLLPCAVAVQIQMTPRHQVATCLPYLFPPALLGCQGRAAARRGSVAVPLGGRRELHRQVSGVWQSSVPSHVTL
jgi:hypothetical protein